MAQKAGQKRKVVEVPRPKSDSEDEGLDDVQLNGGFDGAESSGDESEEELDEEDEGEGDEDLEELDSDEIPSEDDEEDVRQQLRDLKTNGRASTSPQKLMGSDTGRDISTISPDTKVKPSPLGDDEEKPNYRVEEDANGNERYVYGEIEPNYDSDDSDAPAISNTIGNIPLSYYDAYPHIGYDINGRRIARPAKGQALDSLLDSIDVPEGWTGLTDPATGKPLVLNADELETLKKLTRNEQPGDGYDPYPEYVEWFTGKHREEIMPLSAAPEPKRRFVPSMHEHKRVMKMVKAIKEGRIKPFREPTEEEREREEAEQDYASYDIWSNEVGRPDHIMNIPAPKLPPPGYEESYHPPPEYLPDKQEQIEWEDQDPEDRTKEFLPRDHAALRKVPGWENFVSERMNRCLDLYLAPRVRRSKLNIDPESLLPKLPDPSELKPFPTFNDTTYLGHDGRVRCTAIDPAGHFIASGSDDGTVRLWSFGTGRQECRIKLSSSDAVNVVAWRPIRNATPGINGPPEACVLAACCGDVVHFIIPPAMDISSAVEQASQDTLDAGFGFAATNGPSGSTNVKKPTAATWSRPSKTLQDKGVFLILTLRHTPKTLVWHRRGEYFATVCPDATSERSKAVAIHTLSKHMTQHPFRKLKGFAQTATFHPSRPLFIIATRQRIRIYDLQQQKLEKELQPGARYISSISLHPLGNNLLVSSYDKRLLWHDLDLGSTPYKTLRYHRKAIRQVKFHPTLPLFADASDDGTVQIFHGKVVGDSMENATVVPLKVLKGHKVKNDIGVMDLEWHPTEAWLVTSGADGTVRLWT